MSVVLDPRRKTPLGGYVEIDLPEGWPEPHHIARPRDELGQAIIDFANQWRGHPNLQESPWDDRTGRINLIPPDEPRAATDEVPKYRVKDVAAFIGCVLYTRDQVVPFPGWPASPYALTAENESARLVLAYMEKFGAGQKLTGQPHQSGQLFFPNPALRGNAIMPRARWS
jgi:hypothetical protein